MHRREILVRTASVVAVGLTAGCTDDVPDVLDGTDPNDENDDGADGDGSETVEYVDRGEDDGREGTDERVVRSYGEEARRSDGIVTIAHGLAFEHQREGDGLPEESAEGSQYAFLDFEVRNERGDERNLSVAWMDIVLQHGDEEYDTVSWEDGGEMEPPLTEEGELVYEVPTGLSQGDLDTVWHDSDPEPAVEVRWTAGGDPA